MRKSEQEKIKAQEARQAEIKERSQQAMAELTDPTNAGMISPYIRRAQ
jgi:hypothetical protein